MLRSLGVATLALLFAGSSASAQSLAEVAKKEKERRAAEKTTKPVRQIDDSDLETVEGREEEDPEPFPSEFAPTPEDHWRASRASTAPPENPNRRPKEKKPSAPPSSSPS